MFTSVIVPVYNKASTLRDTLPVILTQESPPGDYEVIVVDNGSTDETPRVLEDLARQHPHMRWVVEPVRGPAAARNRGILESRGGLLVFLDNDMNVEPKHLVKHVALHERSDKPLCVVVCTQNGVSSGYPPLHDYLTSRSLYEVRRPSPGEEGLCMASGDFSIKRETLDRVRFESNGRTQYFDETFISREDGELGIRIQNLGVDFRYVDDIVARHVHCYTREQYAARMRNAGYYHHKLMNRHPGVPNWAAGIENRSLREIIRAGAVATIQLGQLFGPMGKPLTRKGVEVWIRYHLKAGYHEAIAAEEKEAIKRDGKVVAS